MADATDLLNRIRGYVDAYALLSFVRSAEFKEKSRGLSDDERAVLSDETLERWGDIVVPWSFDASAGAL